MRTQLKLAAASATVALTAGLLAGCNDPDAGSTPAETVSPEDSMEDDSMEKDDTMEDDTTEEDG